MIGLSPTTARNCAVVLGMALIAAVASFDLTLAHPFTVSKELWLGLVPSGVLALALLRAAIGGWSLHWPRELTLSCIFCAFAGLSLLWAASPAAGIHAVFQALQNCVWLVLGSLALSSSTVLRPFLLGLSVAGGAVAALGLAQWLHWDAALVGTSLERFAALPQVDRPAATFGHVNMASEVALCGFWGALGLLGIRLSGRLLKSFAWCSATLCAFFMVVGGSRAAWIGTVLGGVVWGSLWLRSLNSDAKRIAGVRLACGAAGLVVLLAALDPWVRVPGRGAGADVHPSDRALELLTPNTGTEHERLVLWQNTVAMSLDAPWLGVGAGNWSVAYPAYARAMATLDPQAYNLQRQPEAAHMESLQLLSETGIVGLALMVALFCSALLAGCRRGMECAAPLSLVVALIGASVAAYVFQNPVPSALAWLCMGALVSAPPRQRRFDMECRRPWLLACAALAVFLLIALAWHARVEASRSLQQGRTARLSLQLTDPTALRAKGLEALDALDRATTRRPGDYQLHAERALALWNLGQSDQALSAFERVLQLNPDFVNALLLKAVLLLGRDEIPSAYDLLRRAILIQPESPELRFALGQLFETRARRDGASQIMELHAALAQYRQAVAAREFMPLARIALARLLLDFGGSPAEVIGLINKAEENAALLPDLLAVCARLAGHARLLAVAPGMYGPGGVRTLALWRRVLGLAPQHAEAHLEVALAPLHAGMAATPAQLEMMLQALRAAPASANQPLVHYYRARVCEMSGRAHDALQEWTLVLNAEADEWQSHPRRLGLQAEALAATQRLSALLR